MSEPANSSQPVWKVGHGQVLQHSAEGCIQGSQFAGEEHWNVLGAVGGHEVDGLPLFLHVSLSHSCDTRAQTWGLMHTLCCSVIFLTPPPFFSTRTLLLQDDFFREKETERRERHHNIETSPRMVGPWFEHGLCSWQSRCTVQLIWKPFIYLFILNLTYL